MSLTIASFYFLFLSWVLFYVMEKGYLIEDIEKSLSVFCYLAFFISIVCAGFAMVRG